MNIPTSRKLLYFLIVLVLLMVVTEGAWHIYANHQLDWLNQRLAERNDFLNEDPDLKFVLRPGDWSRPAPKEQGGTFDFHVNGHLLRGPEFPAEKEGGAYRILCLGGSTTFGTGFLADHETYPARLESALHRRFPQRRFQVLNGGVPAYQSVDSYLNLKRLAYLTPDLVLVFHGINDIAWAPDLGEFYFDPDGTQRPLSRLDRRRIDASSFFPQAIYNRFFGWFQKPEHDKPRESIPQRFENGFAANLTRIANLARAIGSKIVFMTFEIGIDPSWPPETASEKAAHYALRAVHLRYDAILPTVRRYNSRVRRLGSELSVPIIELEGRVSKDDSCWADPVHMSAVGTMAKCALVANQLAKLLRSP